MDVRFDMPRPEQQYLCVRVILRALAAIKEVMSGLFKASSCLQHEAADGATKNSHGNSASAMFLDFAGSSPTDQ